MGLRTRSGRIPDKNLYKLHSVDKGYDLHMVGKTNTAMESKGKYIIASEQIANAEMKNKMEGVEQF